MDCLLQFNETKKQEPLTIPVFWLFLSVSILGFTSEIGHFLIFPFSLSSYNISENIKIDIHYSFFERRFTNQTFSYDYSNLLSKRRVIKFEFVIIHT